ncbi:MAG TPA: four helix bundle protein [Phycisphaerales bacterium]|nr:four helix bundle protein [Phycisphaerales bacterium]
MKYERFEDLPVWKDAARLYVGVERLCGEDAMRGPGDLKDQLLRALLSISNNIAEGFERGTTQELPTFLYYARGSAGETRSMLTIMLGSARFAHLKSQIADLRSRCESISRQLRGWADSLQNSDVKGTRYLNDETRRAYDDRVRRRAYEASLRTMLEEIKREREGSPESERAEGERERCEPGTA